ncbi:MAG: class I SAM-dependent methyltransferase [Candidatus Omnitrophota bacterium]
MKSIKHFLKQDNLRDQKAWCNIWSNHKHFSIASKESIVRRWIEEYFKILKNEEKNVLEIGCFPGSHLAVWGELGYELNGIDFYPRVSNELPHWLKSENYKVGNFYEVDFFKYNEKNKFDVVCSFGFIEHFTNFEEVLNKHAFLVKEGGYLVISTPNYRGFIQRILHSALDTASYKEHYIPSMNPYLWKNIAERSGFHTIFCGGFGNFWFWANSEKANFIQKISIKLLLKTLPVLSRLPSCLAYSPCYGLIARLSP